MDTKDRIDANRKRLLVTASILLLIAVISITVMFVSRKYRTFDGWDKYPTKTLETPDERDYPGNISAELQEKLRYLPEDAVVRVIVSNFPIPLEMSKADILEMANAQPDLSFDIE
ncbi:MAG: hypothetical protein GX166_07905 [Clostridiaceae bacterium]|jgi:hypothetical protein|nr:hypothetical protein [Clostridiaceae bacterium]